ncbi:hypothetical protein DH2020_049271 [Rehmannia glutinosa]|uniref:G-type lectin S-receptor-like serine/threonine-protein kinase n=1 Tax=Rehmannia glutinosa TaxID=99300 RepID=A0ABR0U443_REHGL
MFYVEISQDQTFQFFLNWNTSTTYWKSGPWNGNIFVLVPEISYLSSFTFVSNGNETYYNYSVLNNNVFSMLVINATGSLEQRTSLKSHRNWSTTFFQPKSKREVFGLCGAFGNLSDDSLSPCTCLHGFDPLLEKDSSRGCFRKTILQCRNSNSTGGKKDGFLKISVMKLPAMPIAHYGQSEKICRLGCLQNCSCSAYAFGDNGCSIWEGDLFDLQYDSKNQGNGQHLYLKLAHSELQNGKEKKESGEDLLSFDFDCSVKPTYDGTVLRKRNNTDFDLPMFSYASVSAATDNFSPENKLGEGGFGPVYKGELLNGQEIALKRLSKKSGQGIEEFRNEILLIAKLQHRNLVRLLGCCIDPDESILIYEYMPNKSLDFFLFG